MSLLATFAFGLTFVTPIHTPAVNHVSSITVLLSTIGTKPQTSDRSAFVNRVLELTNNERSKFGLQPLTLNENLSQAANWMATDMAEHNYFGHEDRFGRHCGRRISSFGYSSWLRVGENIAAGQITPEQVVSEWMSSAGHRENILRPNFTELGVGYAHSDTSDYQNYWAEEFGSRG